MKICRYVGLIMGVLTLLAVLAWSQSSANYTIESGVFNEGGNPSPVLTSASYQMTLDAIGASVTATGLSSGSYDMDAGFPTAYAPPSEVFNLQFTGKTQFGWNPEPSVGQYNTYRGDLGNFTGYGTCLHHGMTVTADEDTEIPDVGTGYFYLVTAENRINEEGIKGYDSGGVIEPNPTPCP